MDKWLTNELKEAVAHACIEASRALGTRLNARLQRSTTIDERALTEDLVDHLDTRSNLSVWGGALSVFRDQGVDLTVEVEKSTREPKTGADIGFIVDRRSPTTTASYGILVQCKKVRPNGTVDDFFHQVGGHGRYQSDLLLSITPSAFYFLFLPPELVLSYDSVEMTSFIRPSPDHHIPVWNMGSFAVGTRSISNSTHSKAAAIMVVPALAVEAQQKRNSSTHMTDILANSIPFWYWFAELVLPGFVGDPNNRTIRIAQNTGEEDIDLDNDVRVRNSVRVNLGVEG